MMKVLIYGNRKQDDTIWDASTPAKETVALRKLFDYLRDPDGWDVYSTIETEEHLSLYRAAEAGDDTSLKKLLELRQDYEYEEWKWGEVLKP